MSLILATLCYLRKDNKTLFIHKNSNRSSIHYDKWNGLGGKLISGETPEQCAIREVKEESGLLIHKLNYKGLLTFPLFDGTNDWYVFVYTTTSFSGEIRNSAEGELCWVENDKIPELNLWEGDKIFLPWIDKNQLFSARFTYIDLKYTDHEVSFYG
ncbi:MAG: 8-oxo-dGTP diphosphatase [Proteobacteria bacterium]|nr:8-oxo-dGTP diphosphatase [Pseudomonadota bacterium]